MLEEIPEEPDELVSLGRRPGVPLAPEGESRRLADIEAVADDAADRRQKPRRPFSKLRIVEKVVHRHEHPVECVGWRPRLDVTAEAEHKRESGRGRDPDHSTFIAWPPRGSRLFSSGGLAAGTSCRPEGDRP